MVPLYYLELSLWLIFFSHSIGQLQAVKNCVYLTKAWSGWSCDACNLTCVPQTDLPAAWLKYMFISSSCGCILQVFIQGRENLNRAVHEDVVAIEVLPESEWTCPSSLIIEDVEEKPDDEAGVEVRSQL